MSLGHEVACRELLALAQHRQHALVIVGALVLLDGVGVRGEEALEEHDGARGRELDGTAVGGGRCDPDSCRRGPRIGHLRGHRALPDQVVEGELVGIQFTGDLARGAEDISGRPHRLVRLLGVLDLAVVEPRLGGDVVVAVEGGSLRSRRVEGLGRQRGRVGAHVGDVAALVEALRHPHRPLGIPPESPRGLLLQRGGHEGRLGRLRAGLLLHGGDRES